jgi:hypothetical protein
MTPPVCYEITVRGTFGPALDEAFVDLRPVRTGPYTSFRLVLPEDMAVSDVISILEQHHLTILSLTAQPADEAVSQPYASPGRDEAS